MRILYQLPRFSEDLDFILREPNANFVWQPYIEKIERSFKLYGIEPDIQDRAKEDQSIQRMFLKDNSIGKVINLNFNHHSQRKLLIKFEIDINPPLGSNAELKYLDFPVDYAISCQSLPSNFAGKCHALLCRPYIKGRDWFDFAWYIAKKTPVNFNLLQNAINQAGPWKGKGINVTRAWLQQALESKINQINWDKAKMEVQRFIQSEQAASTNLWQAEFFLDKVSKLK